MDGVVTVLFRWVHVAAAAVAIGGVFFMRVVLPLGTARLGEQQRQEVFLSCRRVFKTVIHACILLLLLSGVVNTLRNWEVYAVNRPVMHGLWGPHVMMALVAFGISIWLLKGQTPPPSHRNWAAVNLGLLLTLVAVAGILRWVRERHAHAPGATTSTELRTTGQ